MKARVFVTLKSGVLDPQGQAVQKTLSRLGYEEAAEVRIGKYVELTLDDRTIQGAEEARARVAEMCSRLIANTVIEDYRVEIEE